MTDNLISNVMLASTQPEPEIHMAATICDYSDRRPATIVAIERFKSGARKGQVSAVTVSEDIAVRTDKNGMSDAQTYDYTFNPNGARYTFKVGKNGKFNGLAIGFRSKHYDYSF
jgi:hypothetical protein